eukprot:TRINITY_DN6646_c0_g1_i1.p1 TRINITY_DN6646_c0_g1~~TRINITY_DN6646_c0_g1_i1.p1  ORF type:complete len:113 (-),score=20.71 TRINITY_DN6646_c0_g1_i1:161-499(-)
MASQYEEFKEAVESENFLYIMEKIHKPCNPDISDGEEQLIEVLKKIISEVTAMEKLNTLNCLLNEFNGKYELFMENSDIETAIHKKNMQVYADMIFERKTLSICLIYLDNLR